MKSLFLTPSTKLNAILVVDKKTSKVSMSQHLCMTLLEWTMRFSMGDKTLTFKLPNFSQCKLKYKCDGSNPTHKMSSYLYEDKNYLIFVNLFDK